jgi:hypothetical protein
MAEVRLKAYATKAYILSTDIGSCYHSMYTHAIPWALHGKQSAKKHRWSHDPSFYGNKLDFLVRQCQDGQTKGIPVGPDTSRILSEMVLSAIDARVDVSAGRKIAAGYRYIDDMFYCFSSLQDAEEVLADLREASHHFELELNPTKTSIQAALQFNEEIWPHKVSATRIRRGAKNQRLSLFAYFSSMIDIAAKYSSESIAVYAIKATTTVTITEKNWDIYEAFLIRVSREHTNTVDLVTKIICTYAAMGYPISSSIDDWVNGLIVTHVPANHHFEVAWAIWAAISLKRKLSTETVDVISKTDNPVCALLALHAQEARLCAKPIDTSKWFANLSPGGFYEDRWLLLYEVIQKGWLASPPAQMMNEPFFGALLSNKVSFYAISARNIPVDLPMIQFALRQSVRRSQSSILPGNIYISRKQTREPVPVDRMRGSYGEDGNFEDVEDFDEGPF